jgi:hypothetical protein
MFFGVRTKASKLNWSVLCTDFFTIGIDAHATIWSKYFTACRNDYGGLWLPLGVMKTATLRAIGVASKTIVENPDSRIQHFDVDNLVTNPCTLAGATGDKA